MAAGLLDKADYCLQGLCEDIGDRCVGSSGNRAAAEFFARSMENGEFDTEKSEFPCFEWSHAGASLEVAGEPFQVQVSPYSLGCRLSGPLCGASSLEELASLDQAGKILILSGELTGSPSCPKTFPFTTRKGTRELSACWRREGAGASSPPPPETPGWSGAFTPSPT